MHEDIDHVKVMFGTGWQASYIVLAGDFVPLGTTTLVTSD